MVPTIISPEEDFAYNALVDAYSRLGIQSAMFGHVPFCKPRKPPSNNKFLILKMSTSACTIGDAPPQEGFFGPLTSFLEHLLAAVAPDVTTSFLWRLVGRYTLVLYARRLDAAIERLTDFYFPLQDQDVRPAGGNGAAPAPPPYVPPITSPAATPVSPPV
ncbi:hypothetical protein ACN38_g10031 [Penicillium nordicum]|uniref:Uncharacterized protein n=1 Tax=Penicillium nordicum TaxID=229535 RepID=A0A0N0RXY2_9EURO|nr:hypothetical protein ACN38_g10031 [Penicillium nordicum]